MKRLIALLLTSVLFPSLAYALGETVTLNANAELRAGPSFHSRKTKTTSEGDTGVVVAELFENWKLVCVGDTNHKCENGTLAWAHKIHLASNVNATPAYQVADADVDGETSTAAECPSGKCERTQKKTIAAQATEIADAFDPFDTKGYPLPRAFHRACSSFINRRGLGHWGRIMISAANRVAPRCFYKQNIFGNLCRGYSNLSRSQKNAVIALTFASIAESETQCDPGAQASGIYATADGMFQMEYEMSARARAGRHPRWCRTHTSVNTQSPVFQSECSVSIIEDTVCKWGSRLSDPRGYWEKLRNNRAIARRIRDTAQGWGLCL